MLVDWIGLNLEEVHLPYYFEVFIRCWNWFNSIASKKKRICFSLKVLQLSYEIHCLFWQFATCVGTLESHEENKAVWRKMNDMMVSWGQSQFIFPNKKQGSAFIFVGVSIQVYMFNIGDVHNLASKWSIFLLENIFFVVFPYKQRYSKIFWFCLTYVLEVQWFPITAFLCFLGFWKTRHLVL